MRVLRKIAYINLRHQIKDFRCDIRMIQQTPDQTGVGNLGNTVHPFDIEIWVPTKRMLQAAGIQRSILRPVWVKSVTHLKNHWVLRENIFNKSCWGELVPKHITQPSGSGSSFNISRRATGISRFLENDRNGKILFSRISGFECLASKFKVSLLVLK